jgi:hypothetical protein
MFSFKKYKQGRYNKYSKNGRDIINSKNKPSENKNNNNNKNNVVSKNAYYDTKIIKKSNNFYKSRRNRSALNKTVRFSENLEQKFVYISDETILNNQEKSSEQWDISFDFEELA